jgi:hypothetical protein
LKSRQDGDNSRKACHASYNDFKAEAVDDGLKKQMRMAEWMLKQ